MSRVMEREEARLVRPSMTGGGTAIKARGCPPNLLRNSVPRRPLRQVHGMMGCRTFRSLIRARDAMLHAH
jgi:hypothetical protein